MCLTLMSNALAFVLLCLCLVSITAGQDNDTQCVCFKDMIPRVEELRTTIRMHLFPDGSGRFLMTEKLGVVWIYDANFTRQPEPFLNISDRVDSHELDNGLYGIALHPNYPEDGRVFVNFNVMEGLLGDYATLRQYSVFPDNPNQADVDTEVILIAQNRELSGFAAHSGGEIFFNTDGYLYVAYGDGTQGDPFYVSQNKQEMRGKMLRLDVDNVPEGQAYGIPPDNPFIDEEGTLPEIYALGLRQPWTVTVDRGDPETGEGAGRIFLADCGQRSYEEINLIQKGYNYGWSSREGHACYRYRYCGKIDGPEDFPIISYTHMRAKLLGWCAIGGYVYRGDLNPRWKNAYIHADSGQLGGLYIARDQGLQGWSHDFLPVCDLETCADLGLTNDYLLNIASIGIDQAGELYLITSTTWRDGYGAAIQQIVDPATYVP